MKKIITYLIFTGVLYSALGDYRDWWKRDEDTIDKKIHDVVIGKTEVELVRVANGKIKDFLSDAHENAVEDDDCEGHKSGQDAEKDVENLKMSGYITCAGGTIICHGANAYCCHLSSGAVGCCWNAYIYQLWWFWMIWIIFFFLILACSLACWRRRRAYYRYVVMSNSEYPSYGTVHHPTGNNVAYVSPPGYQPASVPAGAAVPNAPVGPPGYTVSEKPPAYSN